MPSKSDWIKFFERTKMEDTGPELFFDEIARSVGYLPKKPRPVELRDDEGEPWTFRPDRQIDDAYVEILGEYHFTPRQEAKTKWRSRLIVRKTGKRLLLIDAPLLTAEHRAWVAAHLVAFMTGDKRYDRLYA